MGREILTRRIRHVNAPRHAGDMATAAPGAGGKNNDRNRMPAPVGERLSSRHHSVGSLRAFQSGKPLRYQWTFL